MSNAAAALYKSVGQWSGLRQFLAQQSFPIHFCTKTQRVPSRPYRFFSTTSLRFASPKVQPSPKNRSRVPSATRTITPPKPGKFVSVPRNPSYTPFAQSLANRPSPTLLYQVHSQTNFTVGCYIVGTAIVVMAVFNFYTEYLHPLDRTYAWVPVIMAAFCLAMLALGLWVIRRVRLI